MAVNGIYTALTGMNAHRRILDTTAHNVANQATPGYRRQIVDLAPVTAGTGAAVFAGTGNRSLGVDVVDTRRVLDQLAEARANRAVGTAVGSATTRDAMLRIEAVFDEPTERGIATQLDAFWTSWSDLADRADDPVARGEVLSRAQSLIDRLRQASDELQDVEFDTRRQLGGIADEINTLAGQVAELNRSIASATGTPNGLLDERDRLTAKLASMAGAQVQPGDFDQVSVTIGGRLLVGGGSAFTVTTAANGLVWASDGSALRPGPSELASIDSIRADALPNAQGALDAIVATLVTEVNALHSVGYAPDGTTGRDFFDPAGTTAGTISLSADVVGQPENLAAGAPILPGPTAPGTFDGRQAQAIGDLAVNGNADADYRTFIAGLAVDTSNARRRSDTAQQIADRALDEAESVSGVNLDEEMVQMMAAQRGYEASARVLQAVDEMLQTLIGLV